MGRRFESDLRLSVFPTRAAEKTPLMSESDQLGNTPGQDEIEDGDDVEEVEHPAEPWAKTSSGDADEI